MTTVGGPEPEIIGGYRLDELVGRGGMGNVYRAWDQRLERWVALKLLPARLAGDEGFRERLLRESRLAASLDHPNVVPVYDAGEADGRLFLAMRYVEGTDLRAILRAEGALEPARAIGIASQVAVALDAAHASGLIHRDVKPSNVLIDESGHCYLADFGLSERTTAAQAPADATVVGTLDYVAPEQIRGDPVDAAADVYSLACMLFECLTGEPPFRRPSDVATVFAHLEEPPPAASERRRELPPDIDAVLARGMSKTPAERPASCAVLVEEARAALGVGTPARPRRWPIAAVLAVAVAAVAVAVALVVTRDDAAPAAAPGGSLVSVDARSHEVTARIPTSAAATQLVVERGKVWFDGGAAIWRLDPRTGTPIRVESVGTVHALTGLDGRVYVARNGEKVDEYLLAPYDAVTGVRSDGLSALTCSLTADPSVGLWAAGCPDVWKMEIADDGLSIAQTVVIPYAEPWTAGSYRMCLCSMTTGDGAVWVVGDAADPRLWRIDPGGRVSATITLPIIPRTIAATPGSVWVTGPLDDVVLRVDTRTNRVVDQVHVGRGAAGIASSGDAVWVVSTLAETLSRIDAVSGAVTDVIDVGKRPLAAAFGDGVIWVTTDAAA